MTYPPTHLIFGRIKNAQKRDQHLESYFKINKRKKVYIQQNPMCGHLEWFYTKLLLKDKTLILNAQIDRFHFLTPRGTAGPILLYGH